MVAERITISLPAEQMEALKNRVGSGEKISTRVQKDLDTLWSLLKHGMVRVYRKLAPNEAKLVLDVQNSAFVFGPGAFELWLHGGLGHQISDGIVLEGLDRKWNVDKDTLLKKIEELNALEVTALLDWCERMWARCEDQEFWNKELEKFQE